MVFTRQLTVSSGNFPDGIIIGSLNEAAKKYPALIEKHYGKYAKSESDGLIHLNTAMASDGVFIYVPRGAVLKKPVQVVNLVDSEEDTFNQHRNLIIVEENAEFTLIICDHTLSPRKFLTNAVSEIHVGENSHFDIIRVQNEHNNACKITHTFIHQEKNSHASSNNITLHGGLVRNSTYHYLGGEGAECNSYGLYLADKWQHIDNFVNVDHAFPNCTSNQLFKGVLDDMSTGAFNGRIYVAPDAQGTLAYQKNNNILLTDDAKMDTKPQLEIYADDVKCSHGATVGQLDDNALFYLQSRGIDKRQARLMLMFGFAHEVIQNIKVEALRERMDNLVMQRLKGELVAMCKLYGKMRVNQNAGEGYFRNKSRFSDSSEKVYDKPLIYFDNGATTQKPLCVLDAVKEVYTTYNGNIHRGVHAMSDLTSEAYENAREKVRSFINAGKREEIVFTSGTTGSINSYCLFFRRKIYKTW